jgi:hypothetical protein
MKRNLYKLSEEEKIHIFKQSLEKHGWNNEVEKALEELSELMVALIKFKNKENAENEYKLIDEIADCFITVKQIENIFNLNPKVEKIVVNDIKITPKKYIKIANLITELSKILIVNEKSYSILLTISSLILDVKTYVLEPFYKMFEQEIEERINYKLLRLRDRINGKS